ncbi:heparinase, partial [Halobellus sp. Atlit-31R]
FEVPDNATLRARILNKARPRSLPSSVTPFSTWNYAKRTALEPYLSRLANEVKAQTTAVPSLSDSRWSIVITSPLTAAMANQQTDVRQRINEATRQMEAAALSFRLRGDSAFLTEALRRGDELAALNPSGPTSYDNQDQATRQIAWGLAKTIDLLGSSLDATRKARWLAAIKARTAVIYNNLAGDN